jgi:hypothetical protein
VLHCNIAPYIECIQRSPMSKSQQAQAQCICGKPITMMNAGVQKNKEVELFHSVDCALISRRLESVYENSNLFAE